MKKDLRRLLLMKRIMTSMNSGRGISTSIVTAFREGESKERAAARRVLLGHSHRAAMADLASDRIRELAVLAAIINVTSFSSAKILGKKGGELANLLERWLKAREARLLEQRVFEMRGLIMSAVLGAVVAILSALGPVVGDAGLLGGSVEPVGPGLYYASAAMVAVSSSMMGLFLSGRRFVLNVVLALGVYGIALSVAAPIAAVPVIRGWAVK